MSISHVDSPAPADTSPLSRGSRSQRTAELFDLALQAPDPSRRQAFLDEVVLTNLCVARSLARHFIGRGVDVEDLEQVASEALVKAAARFDPARGKDFLSFAVPTVRGELQRHFRDVGWVVRPTRRVQEARLAISRAEAELTQRLGHTPDIEEVMDETALTREEYAEAASASGCFAPTSLDRPTTVSGDGGTLGDLLPDEDPGQPACEARIALAPVVQMLSERDRRVLFLRYFEDLGQKEIGSEIGVTQTQVSRILDRILTELHDAMTDDGPDEDSPPRDHETDSSRPDTVSPTTSWALTPGWPWGGSDGRGKGPRPR
jgi:RNA polymerase sigma-B factor